MIFLTEMGNKYIVSPLLLQKDLMSSSAESEQYERLSSVSSPNQQRLLHPAAARPVLSRSTSYGAHDKMFASAATSAAGITTAGLSAAPTPRHARRDSLSSFLLHELVAAGEGQVHFGLLSNKLWILSRIRSMMTSRAVLLFTFEDCKTIQNQHGVMS